MVWLTAFLIPVTILMTWDEKSGATYHPTLVTYGRCFDWRICRIRLVYVLRILGINTYSMFFLILNWEEKNVDMRHRSSSSTHLPPVSSCFLASLRCTFLALPGSGEGYGDLTGRTFDLTLMLESARSANARGEVWMGMDMQRLYS